MIATFRRGKWWSPAIALALIGLCGCAGQTTGQSSIPASGQNPADCKIDSAKICNEAQTAGTLEPGPPRGYGGQSGMDTAQIAIPNGTTLQAMCYYDPQHKSLTRSDWTSSRTLDASAIDFLRGKGYCARP